MAFVTDKLHFLRIPRTGGTWAIRAMQDAGVQGKVEGAHHSTPDKAMLGKFSFAIVRHPLSWLRSYWSYRRKHNHHTGLYPTNLDKHTKDSFAGFIDIVTTEHPGIVGEIFSEYLDVPGLKPTCVCRQESLAWDLNRVLIESGEYCMTDAVFFHPRLNESENLPDIEQWMLRRVRETETDFMYQQRYM